MAHKEWSETTMDFLEQDDVFIEVMNAFLETKPEIESEFLDYAATYLSEKHPEDFGND